MKVTRGKTPSRQYGLRTAGGSGGSLRSNQPQSAGTTEEVAVYCRIRPTDEQCSVASSEHEESTSQRCVRAVDEETVQLVPPQTSRNFYLSNGRATNYSFKAVFDENSSQSNVFNKVGLPLVGDLLQGKNGLLFTYGVTGSGKTHTMQGTIDDGGVMARALDTIFNSIEDRLVARKYLLLPDKANGFQAQGTVDAAAMLHQELISDMKNVGKGYATRNGNSGYPHTANLSSRVADTTKVADVDQKKVYAVFVSYVEIYNKYVYDLLDDARDSRTGKPKFVSKNVIEDSFGEMYVHDAKQLEVRNAKEALEVFYRGQKNRRVAETQLNHQSSRSHSIFNIRLLHCSPDENDDDKIDDEKPVVISQLSLVDLAGSERTSRTGNVGDRLREAGNINNSLMNLRICIEKLRENQKMGKSSAVPYRNDKMTHLFRKYFEGIGAVRMIVCINPREADYDETQNVLQFAEMAQEIEIEQLEIAQRDIAFQPPAKKRAYQVYQEALANTATKVDPSKVSPSYSPIYSLGPAWPNISVALFEEEEAVLTLQRHIEQRIATRNTLIDDDKEKLGQFRQRLVDAETELVLLREENQRLKSGWEGEKRRARDLEQRLVNAESANTSLQRRVEAFCEQKLDEKEHQLHEQHKNAKKRAARW